MDMPTWQLVCLAFIGLVIGPIWLGIQKVALFFLRYHNRHCVSCPDYAPKPLGWHERVKAELRKRW